MADCTICGEKIPEGSRTCPVCGSSADEFFVGADVLRRCSPSRCRCNRWTLPAGGSFCPACARSYGPEHADGYCTCGTELVKELADEIADGAGS